MARASFSIIECAMLGDYEGIRKCVLNFDVDTTSAKGNTALHIVCERGYEDCARLVVASGASLNLKNNKGTTALHLAVKANTCSTVNLLLKYGAKPDIADNEGNLPLHIAAEEGYLEVAQTLCDKASPLNTQNNFGFTPLHLASINGHIEVVRCLCVSGCDIGKRDNRGFTADIMAFKNLHQKIGILLNKISVGNVREIFVDQLALSEKPIPKQSVKILGDEGVGKSALSQSLNANFFLKFISRSKAQSLQSGTDLTPPVEENRQIESISGQTIAKDHSDRPHVRTSGLELCQVTIFSSDFTLWDFSGLPNYHMVYDFFIGDPCSLYIVVFQLEETIEVQYNHTAFWIKFLQYRLQRLGTKKKIRPWLILVGTHADSARMHKDNYGNYINPYAQEMRDRLSMEFPDIIFYPKTILCDSRLPNSPGLMELKRAIADATSINNEDESWRSTKFLMNMMQTVERLRKEEELFPVISWNEFVDKIHAQVNPLAGPHHVKLVVEQLASMGEIYHLKSSTTDSIILDMNWLCHEIIGELLSPESLARRRVTGCYTEVDFQSFFISSLADKTLPLLEALEICTQCENEGELEYEFPCFNVIEELPGIWSADDERYKFPKGCYGGVRLKAPFHLLKMVFPRIQVHLRRMKNLFNNPDDDLYQWLNGSKYCWGNIESLITLKDEKEIEIKVRGPEELKGSCFLFFENLMDTVQQVLAKMLPNMVCERHILSSDDLHHHVDQPFVWSPENISTAMSSSLTILTTLRNPNNGKDETLLQLIGFGAEEIAAYVVKNYQLKNTNVLPKKNCSFPRF